MEFVFPFSGGTADILQAFLFHQALDQGRQELRADGVGTLDAQRRRVVRGDRQGGGEYRPGEGVTEESEENQAQGTAPEVFVTGALAVWHRGHRLLWGREFAGEIKSDG
ncbi:hypothetical protein P4152_17625 [Pseudomonas aeruginosa]|jgi:hypothetical protein|nr:hypothetical protein [Pseudomonas aeruginosa]MDF5913847.1 hypothetical protein [Pseudomonas aeruginosa]